MSMSLLKNFYTTALLLAFLAIGVVLALYGPTLLALRQQLHVPVSFMSVVFVGRASGSVLGAIIGGAAIDRFHSEKREYGVSAVFAATLFCLGVACWVVPELRGSPEDHRGGLRDEFPRTPVGGSDREELSFDGDLAMLGVLLLCFAVSGFTMGLLDTGGNVAVMHLWAGTSGEGSNTVGRGTGKGR